MVGAHGFEKTQLFCKWKVERGENFDLVEGKESGQTQGSCNFSHILLMLIQVVSHSVNLPHLSVFVRFSGFSFR